MRIGIDLGGTKVEGALLGADGDIVHRIRHDSPQGSYDATLGAIQGLVLELEDRAGEDCTVGVAIPGTVCPVERIVKNANSTWLIGHPLDQDLSRVLGREVRLANDANCFALSEAVDGAAAGAPTVFGAILGTGCGGGLIVNGRPLEGANAIAGEWGHCPLPWPADDERPGNKCYCGKLGCLETWLSGPALAAQYAETSGIKAPPAAIAEAARAGEKAALDALKKYTDRLARSLALIVNIFDPHVIVLGGGLSNIKEIYTPTAAKLQQYIFSPTMRTRIVQPKFGDSSGVRGAAWLWPQEDGS